MCNKISSVVYLNFLYTSILCDNFSVLESHVHYVYLNPAISVISFLLSEAGAEGSKQCYYMTSRDLIGLCPSI